MTALIKVSSSFLRLISFLSLSLLASPTFGAGPVETANAPAWRTATSLISDDGHAQLSWSVPAGEFADYWEVLESRPGKVGTTFYVDQPSVHVFRITPGRYDFRVRSCLRHSVDSTTCGQSSAKLRLLVTENAIPQPNRAAVSSNQSAAVERFGGPAQLRPGGWINPDKDGQGWYFYWANRLRYDEGDPLFGNAYDLVGIWYTFEAKSVYFDDEVCHCNIYDDYLPVTAELRLVSLSESGYTGGIWLTRNGEEIQVGSANLFFGPNNTSATLNWWANFKFEAIPATSESLINIVSNEPLQTDSNAHFSGQWRQPGNANYFIDELLTDTLEVINISFQDSAGDQTWIQATSGNPETSSVSFCAQYLNSGYRPDLVANNGSIYNHWYENGCDVDEIAHDFNRNGRRYFPELESGHFWATFSLPGGAYNSGSVAIGTESVPDVLQKTSNFQRVFYDPSLGSSCQLQTNGSCTLSLTWFTDGDHPDATVWVHDQASGSRTKFMTSTSPVMEDQQLVLTSAGEYEFELRMGDSVSSTLMARSTIFTVLDGSPNLPDTVGALHGRWVDKPAQEFDLAWRHSEPALVTHYEIQETNPDGSVTAPLIHVTGGNAIAWNFDKTGELPGQYQYRVRACNGQGCSEYTLPLNWYTQDPVNQASIFDDDFESSQGWTTDLDGTDTASTGQWERANPSTTSRLGTDYQLGTTVSGFQDLVTQAPAGSSWGSYDIDRGVTSITSPLLALPAGDDPLVLRFHYYFAHSSSAGSGDFFRAYIEAPGQDWLLLEELGDPAIDGGAWQEVGLDLTPWSGQSVRIRFEAADGADAGTIAEAGIDDVKLTAFGTPNAPPGITNPGAQSSNQNETITPLNLAVSDADGDTLSCSDGGTLPAGLGVAIDGGNANCVISGTLTAAASTYAVIITVDDGAGGHANTAFNWTVNDSGSSTNPEVPPAPAGPPNMSPSLSSSESGATPGHFRVDESGSARYSIPLLTAPGSGGLAPQITLEYSSQSGNGPLGVGWSLGGLSEIARCAQTIEQDGASGSVNLDSDDRFCLDGQRLLLVSGAYGASGSEYRTEIDAIARIKAFGNMGSGPASFAVEHKNGSVSHYGDSPDSQIQADGEVLTWARNRLEDSAGNYILYHYTESSNPIEFVISQIEYTGNGSQSPFAKLDFIWASDRSDATRVYIGGVELQQTQYLERIDSRAKKNAASAYTSLRSYFMSYADDGMGRKSLQSIEECNNQAKQACFAPTSFTWVNALSGIGNTISHNNLFPNKQVLYGLQVADVSGDGRPDVLYTRKSGPNYKLHIESPSASGIFSGWGGSYTLPKNADGLPPKVFGMDLDADGYQDVIYRKHVGNNRYQWAALRSTGSSLLPEIILSPHSFIVNEDQAGIESRISVVDFNGDGISDLMYNKTSAVGDQHDIEVAVNTWTPGGTLGLSSPIEISSQFGDLFPSPVGDAQGNLWETFAKPNFTDWNTTQLQGRNTPDARVFDFNGDGAVDVLIKVSREYRNCISNCPKEQSLPGPGEVGAQASPVYQFTDVAFWVLMDSTGSEGYTQNIIAVGTGCILPDPCNATPGLPASDFIWPVDINADALADIAFSDNGNGWHYRLNTGDGFTATQDITNTPSPLPGGQQDLVRFEDFNGDGYPDLVYPSGEQTQSATWRVIYNRFGQAFDDPTVTSIKAGNVGGTTNVENDASIFADFNGDGKSDHFYINFNSQGKPSDSDLYLGRNQLNGSFNTAPTNVITAINNGLGALTIISYSPLTDSSVYTRMNDARNTDWGAGSVVYDLIAPIYVVNKVSGSAPTFASTSATSSVEYHYVGAKMQSGGRGFLGFGEVISFDPQDGIRTNTRYRQDSPFIGMPADTTVSLVSINQKFDTVSNNSATSPATWGAVTASTPATSPSGTKLSYAINEWAGLVTAGGAVFPHIAKSLERRYTLQGVFDRKVLTSNVPDENGNLTSIIQKTYSTDGDSAFAIRTTSNTYKDNISNWHFGLLGTSIVTHTRTGQTSITRQSSYDYDTDTGILDKEIIEPNNSAFKVTKDYQLDRFGNYIRTTVTGFGMVSRVSEAEYDSYGRFVIESRNDLGQITHKVNDHDAFGNVLESENIDGVMTFYAADFMGRPFVSYTETGKFSKTLHSNSSASCPAGTAIKTTTSGGGVPDEVLCQDVRGRTIRSATVGFDGTLIYVDQYFSASGRAERVSEPYFAGSARYWNLSAYDALGRPTTLTSASGDDQIFEYDADANIACTATDVRVKQVTNGLGQVHVEVSNALGELVETYDDACGNVRYENDAVGNLTRVTGADHEVVSMSYDLAGRKIAMNDPDKGAWQYSYNPLGELIRQLDSKFQAIDFVYDTLGRVTDRLELSNVSSLTDSTVTTHHHETTNFENSTSALVRGKGQPINIVYRANDSGAVQHQRIFSYDSFGRVSEASSVLEGSPFSEVTTYDQFGRIFQRFDASGDNRGLRSHYNTRGYLSRLQEAREGTLGTVYQETLAMDARGNATRVRLGNGVDVFASYDAPSGRLNDMSAYDGSIELQNVDYLFDVLGNLKERHDLSVSTNLKETFNYDDLNRLLNVNLSVNDGTATQTLALSYDAAGNFTYKSDVGGYLYNGNQPHAVKNAGGVTYNYDNNGNQLAGGGRTISYTVFDKPELISSNGQSVAFGYGITNARYKREDISGAEVQKTTLYMGSVERIEEGGSISYKRHLGGAAIATYYAASGSQSIHYLLKDHIGSIHTVLDEGKQITATMHFSAFGQRQDIDWQTPLTAGLYAPLNDITTRGFTGHEQVDDFGIIHMNGRIYDAKLGRFLQADPIVQAPRNSQNLNRYSYVLNNPLSFTDPSGFFLKRLVRKWGRVIVAAVAGYFTFNTSYAWASKILGASSAAGTSITTFAGFKAAAASVAGATSGFVSAGVLSETARGAVRGAFAGALTIGTNKYYGNRYDLGRVVVETLIGGANSRILGGKFDDGLRSAFTTSVLNYANYRMRRTAGAVADKNPANTGKASRGFYGDQTARAGALRTPNPEYPDDSGFPFLKCDSTAGACQGNEVFHPQDIVNSRLGPFFYPPYGTVDYVLESFAGPHDWLRLKTGSYDPLTGLNLYREGIAEVWDGIKNYGLIPVAAPFAAAAILVTSPNLHLVTQFQIHGN